METFTINQRIRITGPDHPWHGRTGRITHGLRRPSVGILEPMYTVELDDPAGHGCMVKTEDLEAEGVLA